MKYLWGIVGLFVIVFLFLIVRVVSLGNEIQALDARNGRELAAIQDSLKRAKPISQPPENWRQAGESI
jgi:hypothetical protein